ncbi:MAG: NUDIX hydrolase [Elusimicrobia bacterium]|nr:NUDIX hydrolase [Elusimicrobiota bacterium]MDE2237786.1 NUDIX hydrolase [Elusimicrobiota bacterium]MDE2425360.1 NUDIX hydrolase [Elusimicrobiota bacterium]
MPDPERLFAPDPGLVETRLRKNTVYEGKMVDFCCDDVKLPHGGTATREYIDHPGAVGVVPLLADGRVVLVRQYRYPVGEVTLELPAGKLDEGEDVLACVKRELREETGYTAGRIVPLLDYWPTPAFANEVLHLFVAQDLEAGASQPDEDELIEVVRLPFEEALALARSGRIKDSKTLVGLLACALWRR